MVKVKNTSEQPQHFVGIGTFEPEEVRDVSEEEAAVLLRSPHIEAAGSMKGVEPEPTQDSKSANRRRASLRGVED